MNIKKDIIIMLLLIFITSSSIAQYGLGSTKNVKAIKETETIFILLEKQEEYNTALKAAVEKYWTFTPFRFVKNRDFKKYENDINYSSVKLYNISITRDGSFSYDLFNLGLFLHQKKKTKKQPLGKSVSSVNIIPQRYWLYRSKLREKAQKESRKLFRKKEWVKGDDMIKLHFSWFFDALTQAGATQAEIIRAVQLLNNYCHIAFENEIGKIGHKKMIKAFNENKKDIKKKTLLIAKTDVSSKKKNNEQALKAAYKYKIKFVEEEEIWKAIEDQKEDVCYAVIYYEEKNLKLKAIIQAKDSKVLYGEVSKMSNGLFNISTKTLKSVLEK